jgi:hypothetical protein
VETAWSAAGVDEVDFASADRLIKERPGDRLIQAELEPDWPGLTLPQSAHALGQVASIAASSKLPRCNTDPR